MLLMACGAFHLPMPPLSAAFIIFLAAAGLFAYLDGVTDSANVVAPVVAARAINRRRALWMTTLAVAAAPLLFGVAVARTFGTGLLAAPGVSLPVVTAGTLAAVVWRILTLWWRLPASNSHCLIGGLLGAALASGGPAAVNGPGLAKVLLALLISPAAGLVVGFVITRLIYWLAQWASPRINTAFRRAQVLTAFALALSWGANDAQKSIGLLALGVAAASGRPFSIPLWVMALSIGLVAVGTLTSARRLIRTLGGRFYHIRPINGLAAQLASAVVIFAAATVGGPVSTTQVVSTGIMGAGAAERVNKVRWGVATNILIAWVLTIPATAVLGGVFLWLLRTLGA
jgi:inorganic phosphate transporter, PiT family